MKCVCGYEHEKVVKDEKLTFIGTWYKEYETVKGDEPFIHLGSVTGVTEKESNYYEKYACPKCGTLKIIL